LTFLFTLPVDPHPTVHHYTNEAFNHAKRAKGVYDVKPPKSSYLFVVPARSSEHQVGCITLYCVEKGSGQSLALREDEEEEEESVKGGYEDFGSDSDDDMQV
jgi:hypothetical protein